MNQIDNLSLMEDCFRSARITGDLSDSSIKKYQSSLNRFFMIVKDKTFDSLEIRDFEDFTINMQQQGASSSRIANIIAAVKWTIDSLQRKGAIPQNLDLSKVRKPKVRWKDVNYLTEDEIATMISTVKQEINKRESVLNVRFMAFIMMLFQTGARIGEILSINIEDIDRQNREVDVIGKGSKPRTLFLKTETLYWIDRYLSTRCDSEKALFAIQDGSSHWKQTDAGRAFRKYKKLSGIHKKIVIHTLRHTFATHLLMKGAGINVVQAALGHSSPVTTLKYYSGAVEKAKVKEMINDSHFDFIPETAMDSNKA